MSYWKLVTYGYIRRIQKYIGNDRVIPDDIMLLCSKYSHAYNLGPRHVCTYHVEDERDEELAKAMAFIRLVTIPCACLLIFFAIATLGMYITGFVLIDLKNIIIWVILAVSMISSILGVYATYKYDIIHNLIDELKAENAKYEHECNELFDTQKRLGHEVKETQIAVQDCAHDTRELGENTIEMEFFLDDLRNIASDNKDILILLDKTNKIHNNMRKVVLETERTHVLSMFYECIFRDDDNRMYLDEYNRFLRRLSRQLRQKWKDLVWNNFGYFYDNDDHIDLQEFEEVLEEFLIDIDAMIDQLSLIMY